MRSFLSKVKVLATGGNLALWHGGDLDSFKEAVKAKGGRWEFGPGLYLTTHYDTAKKYAKGSRKLYKVVIKKGVNLRDVNLPLESALTFIDTYAIKAKRKDLIERINKHVKSESINADTFLNILINESGIKNTDTDSLRRYLVDSGIDYSIQDNAFGWRERMVVLFNMKNIITKTQIKPSDEIEEFDLPIEFK